MLVVDVSLLIVWMVVTIITFVYHKTIAHESYYVKLI